MADFGRPVVKVGPSVRRLALDTAGALPRAPTARAPSAKPREPELPRVSRAGSSLPKAIPTTLVGRVNHWFREHKAPVAAVLLGASGLPALVGCSSNRPVPTPAERSDGTLGFDQFRARAEVLNAKRGSVPDSELAAERAELWRTFASAHDASQDVDADADGLSLAREILWGTSDTQVDTDADGLGDGPEVEQGRDPAVAQPPEVAARFHDVALSAAFPDAAEAPVGPGATGPRVTAVQYALGRLGHLHELADGVFGNKTVAAVRAFQAQAGLAVDGVVGETTLAAMDTRLADLEHGTPASRAANPLAFLSSFHSFDLSMVTLTTPGTVNWSHPQVREAYGRFVGEYWDVLKANGVEADCKTLALFFMDQFRAKMLEDTGFQLPRPSTALGSIPNRTWIAATTERPVGFFTNFAALETVRPGYESAQAIERLDPSHSMLTGVNLRYADVSAPQVARAASVRFAWDPAMDNHGNQGQAEIPIDSLEAGDIVFIDHTGDGTYDHTVNVIEVTKDSDGRVRALRLAVGSFDDMKDGSAETAPGGLGEVNNYTEEVVIRFSREGRITGSAVTWSSEPSYVVPSRYAARNTLMELKPGGTLLVSRWG